MHVINFPKLQTPRCPEFVTQNFFKPIDLCSEYSLMN